MIDIQEVGTGGGSIARVEVGNALRVGPESAGAAPGPVCYGLGGTEPTITDANLMLGRLGADRFLGGEMKLDLDAAKKALTEKIAKPLGLDRSKPPKASCASPPRKWRMWCAGSPPSAVSTPPTLPRRLRWRRTAARVGRRARAFDRHRHHSRAPGHFSACGMLVADLRRDFVNTWFTPLADASFPEMEKIFAEMERQGRETVGRGQTLSGVEVRRSADMRYVGQEHAVTVELPIDLFTSQNRDGIKKLFDAVHQTRYGFSVGGRKSEIVSLRGAVIGEMRKPPFEHIARAGADPDAVGLPRQAAGLFRQAPGFVETPTYDRPALKAGNKIAGPALIEEHASTDGRASCDAIEVDAFGDLVITFGEADDGRRRANQSPKTAGANPVVTEIVRNGLVAVTEEMKINLMRTAYNMIIYEALDFTVGLFDARGNIVSIGSACRCSSAA
jgi:N-methylhydantoinase A